LTRNTIGSIALANSIVEMIAEPSLRGKGSPPSPFFTAGNEAWYDLMKLWRVMVSREKQHHIMKRFYGPSTASRIWNRRPGLPKSIFSVSHRIVLIRTDWE
jgi:hypothetical protein